METSRGINLEEPIGYPAQPGLICPSVCLSVRNHPPRLISDYLVKQKVLEQEFQRPHQHHLSSINSEIDSPDDGNFLIAGQILGNQQAKIRWGLLTP